MIELRNYYLYRNRCLLFLNYDRNAILASLFFWKQCTELRGTSRTICANNIESRKLNLSLPLTDFLRIVRSSRGWLTTGPKFKLHPRTESLMRAGARPRHHAGANFSQVLQCHSDGKLGYFRANFRSRVAFPDARKSPRRNFNCVLICSASRIVSLLYAQRGFKID